MDSSVDNADLYEIAPAVSYPSADLDYNTDCQVKREQNDPNARPEISGRAENPGDDDLDQKEEIFVNKLNVTFNGCTYTATLAERNAAVEAFVQTIRDNGGSITISAHDYGGWEKVGGLGEYLGTANNVQTHTVPGDFVLYSGNQVVLFYGSNDWSYTLLGHLDGDLSNLKSDLGNGNVNITFYINQEG